jgi:hypothetical protein
MAAARRAAAKVEELRETIEELEAKGLSLTAMAVHSNDHGVLTSRGRAGGWTATAVRRVLARLVYESELRTVFWCRLERCGWICLCGRQDSIVGRALRKPSRQPNKLSCL